MMKTLILSSLIFLITGHVLSQETKINNYSIDSLKEYRIKSIEMSKIIDTVIFYTQNCGYYSALNKPYLIYICIYDSTLISTTTIPYNCTKINLWRADSRTKEEGFCIYRERVVFVTSFISGYIANFFEPTGKEENIYYHNSKNILDHTYSSEGIEIVYNFDGSSFIRFDDDFSLCRPRYYFQYMIQSEDTWSAIANECGCSVETLTENFPDKEKPIPGYLIIVEYGFNDGKLIGIARVQ